MPDLYVSHPLNGVSLSVPPVPTAHPDPDPSPDPMPEPYPDPPPVPPHDPQPGEMPPAPVARRMPKRAGVQAGPRPAVVAQKLLPRPR
ncbi:hypothetical protein [Roseicitreum antarcticum]|uniref:Uncharacterized protein n=1 Tax=Roseicitreum antarcticum TaxID=564137 RepID=A0A1H2YUR4_9RHOB|nr:hypothetical protein [Roseicitreum antarcticum]SDX08478.1 hypothetical protein SAMN04488238_105131 [Roseicitreum antarcticum]